MSNKNLIEKLLKLRKELHKWRDAGKPIRTKEQIEKIHSICTQCPHFKSKQGFLPNMDQCGICECNLSANNKTRLNKIALGTTKCPDNPPRWGPETPSENS